MHEVIEHANMFDHLNARGCPVHQEHPGRHPAAKIRGFYVIRVEVQQ